MFGRHEIPNAGKAGQIKSAARPDCRTMACHIDIEAAIAIIPAMVMPLIESGIGLSRLRSVDGQTNPGSDVHPNAFIVPGLVRPTMRRIVERRFGL